jgi:hypothetical protein
MTHIRNASATGLHWTKSSFSGSESNCVETAAGQLHGAVPVRDSKNPTGPALVLRDSAWAVFVDAVKADVV